MKRFFEVLKISAEGTRRIYFIAIYIIYCNILYCNIHNFFENLEVLKIFKVFSVCPFHDSFLSAQQLRINKITKLLAGSNFLVTINSCASLLHYSPVLLFYNPLKHLKNFRFSEVFRGYRKATPGLNGLRCNQYLFVYEYFKYKTLQWKLMKSTNLFP